jgi:hypothetical protein
MGVADVDEVVTSVHLPIVVTLLREDVLKLGDKFLQVQGFPGVQVRPGTG